MKISASIRKKLLNKIAQETPPAQPTAPAPITGTNKPLADNINAYLPLIQSLPNVNIRLFSNIDWPYLSKIIGVIDHLLAGISDQKFNFHSIAIVNQGINTSVYPNSQGLTALIQLTHYLYKTITVPANQEYALPIKKQLLNILTGMVNNSSISSFPSSKLKELGSPHETLLNTITAWSAILK